MSEINRFLHSVASRWPVARWRDVHVLVGVSGGPDSMALLRALVALRPRDALGKIHAAHVNHQLRGAESDAHEAWLANEMERLQVPLVVRRGEVAAHAALHGDGLEAAARDVRYRLLSEMADQAGARYVAVGHTRDDQVETVLFRIVRGTGLRGLGGMPAFRSLGAVSTLVRPLLSTTRAEVEAYLGGIGQAYCHDASNDSLAFSRNRIRAELVPLLQSKYHADVQGAVVRLAEQATQAQGLIEELAAELRQRAGATGGLPQGAVLDSGRPIAVALRTDVLRGANRYLVAETWRLAWREAGLSEQAMRWQHWQQLADLGRGDSSLARTSPDSSSPDGSSADRSSADRSSADSSSPDSSSPDSSSPDSSSADSGLAVIGSSFQGRVNLPEGRTARCEGGWTVVRESGPQREG